MHAPRPTSVFLCPRVSMQYPPTCMQHDKDNYETEWNTTLIGKRSYLLGCFSSFCIWGSANRTFSNVLGEASVLSLAPVLEKGVVLILSRSIFVRELQHNWTRITYNSWAMISSKPTLVMSHVTAHKVYQPNYSVVVLGYFLNGMSGSREQL